MLYYWCWGAWLRLLALLGMTSFFASSGCSDGRHHHSCETQPPAATAPSLNLVQAFQVRSKKARYYEEDKQQSYTDSVLMQRSNAANKTASADGMAVTQQPGVVDRHSSTENVAVGRHSRAGNKTANLEGPHADWHAGWHAWQLSCQNGTLALTELGSRKLQAAWAFFRQATSRMRETPLTSIRLMLQQVDTQGIMGPWGWVILTWGVGVVAMFIVMSLSHSAPSGHGRHKHLDNHDLLQPISADMLTLASTSRSQRASMPEGDSPHGYTRLGEDLRASPKQGRGGHDSSARLNTRREIMERSLGLAESYCVKTCAASAPMFMHSSNLDVGTNLCPGLVVPPRCECTLRLPVQACEGHSFDVTDRNGHGVMRGIFRKSGDQQQIMLTTESGDILAQCKPAPGTPGEFQLLRAHGGYFGKLVQGSESDKHSVWTASGAEFTFSGSAHTVNISDTSGRLLAMTEPETGVRTSLSGNKAYLLHVAPLMDVSVVICGLLIINHLM